MVRPLGTPGSVRGPAATWRAACSPAPDAPATAIAEGLTQAIQHQFHPVGGVALVGLLSQGDALPQPLGRLGALAQYLVRPSQLLVGGQIPGVQLQHPAKLASASAGWSAPSSSMPRL